MKKNWLSIVLAVALIVAVIICVVESNKLSAANTAKDDLQVRLDTALADAGKAAEAGEKPLP